MLGVAGLDRQVGAGDAKHDAGLGRDLAAGRAFGHQLQGLGHGGVALALAGLAEQDVDVLELDGGGHAAFSVGEGRIAQSRGVDVHQAPFSAKFSGS